MAIGFAFGTHPMKARDVLPAIWAATLWAGAPMFWYYWLKAPFFLPAARGLQDPHVGGPVLVGTAICAALLTAPQHRSSKTTHAAAGFLLAVGLALALYVEHSGFLVFLLASYALLRAIPLVEGAPPTPSPRWRDLARDKLWGMGRWAMVLVAVWAALMYFDVDPMNLLRSGQGKLNHIAKDTKALTDGKALDDLRTEIAGANGEQQPASRDNDETAQITRDVNEERRATARDQHFVLKHIREQARQASESGKNGGE